MPAPYSLMDGRCLGRRKPSAVSDDRCNRSGRGYGGRFVLQFREAPPKLSASSQALGLDQVPESLFPMLACRDALSLTIADIALGVGIFFIGALILSRFLFRAHLR